VRRVAVEHNLEFVAARGEKLGNYILDSRMC
jgi:hypothetical protein